MIRIIRGDITELQVDAIVNAANSELMPGWGVDGAIHDGAGPGLKNEVRSQHNYLAPGKAIITSGYRLPAKYVIHTVAPIWSQYEEQEALRLLYNCYNESLSLALKDDIHSVAFPSLGTGAFGVPIEKAIPVALSAIADMLEIGDLDLTVTICCFTSEDFEAYTSAAEEMGAEQLDDDGNPVEKALPDCPQCFHGLKKIRYGMVARGPDTEDVILGGCIIMEDNPSIGCKNCHWEGHPDTIREIEGTYIFAIVDQERRIFNGGAIYESGRPRSFANLIPGHPEYRGQGASVREMQERIESCEVPTLWLGHYGNQLIYEAFGPLLLDRRVVTPEVMRFLGFSEIENLPAFEEID